MSGSSRSTPSPIAPADRRSPVAAARRPNLLVQALLLALGAGISLLSLASAARLPRGRPAARAALLLGALAGMLVLLWLSAPSLPRVPVSADAAAAQAAQAQEVMEGRVVAVQAERSVAPGAEAAGDAAGNAGGGRGGLLRPTQGALLRVEITRGSQRGRVVQVELAPSSIVSLPTAGRTYRPGDRIVLSYQPETAAAPASADDASAAAGAPQPAQADAYRIVDYVRWPWLLWGAALFAAVIVVVARGQGLRALIGLGSAVCVLWWFTIPRLLTGQPPVPVALVTCALIAVPSLLIAHGADRHGLVPLAGIGGSLALVGVLVTVAVRVAKLSGLSTSEEINLLVVGTQGAVDPQGLLLAGMLVGVVGGLVDVTVGQSAAVFEFHEADPGTPRGELFRRGMSIGRAHVAAAVHTLVLAYAGAALPLLLLLSLYASFLDVLWNRELIVAEVLRSVAGSVGLAAAMPLTTWIACLACRPAPGSDARVLAGRSAPIAAHGHRHG